MRAVNLLPPDTRGASTASADRGAAAAEAKGGAGPFVLLGVLAACAAGVAGSVLTDNTIRQHRAELEVATQRQRALAAQAAKLKPFADFDATARARVQTVRDLAGSRFDWEQALRDLSRAIPQDVTLKSLDGDISADAGRSTNPLRAAITAPAITLSGCAPGQTQVARMLARLGDIDGVTRVSLSKSAKEKVQSNADGSAAEARRAAPCGAGKRPAFEVVMFFEQAAAKVATTPTTSTGSVSATPTPEATPTATPEGSAALEQGAIE